LHSRGSLGRFPGKNCGTSFRGTLFGVVSDLLTPLVVASFLKLCDLNYFIGFPQARPISILWLFAFPPLSGLRSLLLLFSDPFFNKEVRVGVILQTTAFLLSERIEEVEVGWGCTFIFVSVCDLNGPSRLGKKRTVLNRHAGERGRTPLDKDFTFRRLDVFFKRRKEIVGSFYASANVTNPLRGRRQLVEKICVHLRGMVQQVSELSQHSSHCLMYNPLKDKGRRKRHKDLVIHIPMRWFDNALIQRHGVISTRALEELQLFPVDD
jgi:hypothetical protein